MKTCTKCSLALRAQEAPASQPPVDLVKSAFIEGFSDGQRAPHALDDGYHAWLDSETRRATLKAAQPTPVNVDHIPGTSGDAIEDAMKWAAVQVNVAAQEEAPTNSARSVQALAPGQSTPAAATPPLEPVAWFHDDFGVLELSRIRRAGWRPLYAAPISAQPPSADAVDAAPTEFCWLVELFEPGGNSMGFYHTGLTDIGGHSRSTKAPHEAKRYATQKAAQMVADALLSKAGVWKAVEHGFEPAEGYKAGWSAGFAEAWKIATSRPPAAMGETHEQG